MISITFLIWTATKFTTMKLWKLPYLLMGIKRICHRTRVRDQTKSQRSLTSKRLTARLEQERSTGPKPCDEKHSRREQSCQPTAKWWIATSLSREVRKKRILQRQSKTSPTVARATNSTRHQSFLAGRLSRSQPRILTESSEYWISKLSIGTDTKRLLSRIKTSVKPIKSL